VAVLCAASVVLGAFSTPALAGDWPQILGPHRNGRADGETLQAWKESGPKRLWSRNVGMGYAGAVVQGNRTIVFHRVGGDEIVECWNVATGEPIWKTTYPAAYRGGVNADLGPRCTPIIHKDKVIVYGAAGDLHVLQLSDGAKLWTKETWNDYDAPDGYFGAGSSPLVADNKVLINVGGSRAAIVALSLADGQEAWTALDDQASYSSPTLAKINGQLRAVFVTRMKAAVLDPQNGEIKYQATFGARGPTVNAATPLVVDNQLFLSAAYGVGARLVDLSAEPKVVWQNDDSMSSQYTTCVTVGGILYGSSGREDFRNGDLRCVDWKSGKVLWSEKKTGVAHVILAGQHLLVSTIDGRILLLRTNPKRYEQLAEARVVDGLNRVLPALANGRLLLRKSSGERSQMICLQVGKTN
jgi:outer membrane protein assembly factor BamB